MPQSAKMPNPLLGERIVRLQLPEQVRDRLRALILAGDLAPGARLIERDLADLLGVSRTPVREALFQLRREGLVSGAERGGLFVSPLDEAEIAKIYALVAALERAALRLLPEVPASLPSELAAARKRLAESRGEPARTIEADAGWHEALTRSCPNDMLLEMLKPLRAISVRYERAFFSQASNLSRSSGEHEAIETLLRAGELEKAADAVEAHWLGNIDAMRAAVSGAARSQKSRVSP
jgi:DNA-binding GntR family transcriptional regulator